MDSVVFILGVVISWLYYCWAKREAREVCQRRRGDRRVLSRISGALGGNGIAGSKHYVFENNLKEEGDCIPAKHLAFGVGLPRFKCKFCHVIAM